MLPIDWDEKYSVDVQEIDDQHKKLFSLFNKLQDLMIKGKKKTELEQVLAELIDYTVIHFATEEKLMHQFSYIGYVEHKRTHDNLLAEAKELQENFIKDSIILAEDLSVFLTDWLTDHILDVDKKYAPLFKSKGVS